MASYDKPRWVNFTARESSIDPFDTVIQTVACPLCYASQGKACTSYSQAVGTCTLKYPHEARKKAFRKRRRTLAEQIETGFGNDDQLMEKALDYEPGEPYTPEEDLIVRQEKDPAERVIWPHLEEGMNAPDVINGVRCNFCGSPLGDPCVIWNKSKSQPREYPHRERYSDYNKLVHRQEKREKFAEIYGNRSVKAIVLHTTEGRSEPVARKDVLVSHLDRVLTELDKLEALGEDVYEDESVLLIKYKHTEEQEKVYSYVALKVEGRWFLSGYQNEGPRSWNKLAEFFSHGIITEMWYVTGWDQVI